MTGPGKVSVHPSSDSYESGAQITLSARPSRRFVAWGGDLTGSSPSVTITIESDTQITATFVK